MRCALFLVCSLLMSLADKSHTHSDQNSGNSSSSREKRNVIAITEFHNVTCIKMPVYLKFHKVGSASVKETLRAVYLDERRNGGRPYWWRNTWEPRDRMCIGDPWDHSVLELYRLLGREKIQENCLTSDIQQVCNQEENGGSKSSLVITASIREPVEKVISQLYFFYGSFERALNLAINTSSSSFHEHQSPSLSSLSKLRRAKFALEKLHNNTRGITSGEMQSLFEFTKDHTFNSGDALHPYPVGKQPGDLPPNNFLFEYEPIFGRYRHDKNAGTKPFTPSAVTLQAALNNMRTEIDVIGTTEFMESYWVLLSAVTKTAYPQSCLFKEDHGSSHKYQVLFGQSTRPTPEQLFSAQVLSVIRKELTHETTLWEEARQLHKEQLLLYTGLTVEQGVQSHNSYCESVHDLFKAGKVQMPDWYNK